MKKGEPAQPRSTQPVPVLAPVGGLWQEPPPVAAFSGRFLAWRPCCRSSVVEHSLGKGEVDSSILSGSTIEALRNQGFSRRPLPTPPPDLRERKLNLSRSLGENLGNLFSGCSLVEPPDPETGRGAVGSGLDLQVGKPRQVFSFFHSIACTIATFAYGVVR